MLKNYLNIFKSIQTLLSVICIIIGIGIWIGAIQYQANATEKLLSEHISKQDKYIEDSYKSLSKMQSDIAVIKYRVEQSK